jgi:hypothetical protein
MGLRQLMRTYPFIEVHGCPWPCVLVYRIIDDTDINYCPM